MHALKRLIWGKKHCPIYMCTSRMLTCMVASCAVAVVVNDRQAASLG